MEADFMEQLLVELYCDIDDFSKAFDEYWRKHLLTDGTPVIPKCAMCLSEIMTIVILFHLSNHRTFKWYYKNYICGTLQSYFPQALSYNRFIEIMQGAIVPLTVYLMKFRTGKCSGISFLDSTTLDVCHNRRINSHKVFKNIAKRGKSSTGWFYGFKLHLVINDEGEILSFCLTAGNVDDRDWQTISMLTGEIFGKLFADKGYISQELFEKLFQKDITLITKIKKNMKNRLMDIFDKLMLRKRAIVESVNDFLKNICQIEHTRHRSFSNFVVNLLSGLVAYSFLPKKPSLRIRESFCLHT
jgi:hypothetical protein